MPKRLRPEQLEAAVAAGEAPRSEDYPGDDSTWYDEQDNWLARWQPRVALPARGNTRRRTEWNALTKKHQYHFEAAQAAQAGGDTPDPQLAPPEAPGHVAPPPVDVLSAEYSRSWELHMLRRICLGRGVDHSVSDTNEDLLTKLASALLAQPAPVVAAPEPIPAPPNTVPPAIRGDAPLSMQTVADLRRQCRERGLEYSISETSQQLAEKLARAAGPAG